MDHANGRHLVIARVGDNSLHGHWIAGGRAARDWDIQLNAFGRQAAALAPGDLPTVVDPGTKLDSLARHLRAMPALLEDYDYILLPDDDLLMGPGDIDRIFAAMRRHDLLIGQPALTPDSHIGHPIFLHCPGFRLRYTDYLEGMACCFRSDYLRQLLPLFERYPSGWGISHLWALLMEAPYRRAAIIDEVRMVHTRPFHSGPLYCSLAAGGISPAAEVAAVRADYAGVPRRMTVYGGLREDGRSCGAGETLWRNGLHLLGAAPAARNRQRMLRKGTDMLARAVLDAGYRPRPLRQATAATLGSGRTAPA